MQVPRLIFSLSAAGVLACNAGWAPAQDFPSRPVRIVTSEIGGLNDFTARMIAQGLSGSLGQPVIVDNRGIVSIDIVAKAAPDGYTLLCFANNFWLLPYLQDKVSFDPVRDFSPVTLAVTAPNVLVTHASLPVSSVRELIALAKAKPGALNYGAGAPGGTPHLAAELFKSLAGINIVRINYKGTGPAVTALVGGQIQMMFATTGSVDPHVKAGRLKALAVTSARPTALAPGLPTLAAEGLAGYEAIAMTALLAPAKVPGPLVNRLSQEMAKVLHRPEVKERFMHAGTEVVGSSPPELARLMKSEMAKWGKVIKQSGMND